MAATPFKHPREVYADEISRLRELAKELEIGDWTCGCEWCLFSQEASDRIAKLADWIGSDDAVKEYELDA